MVRLVALLAVVAVPGEAVGQYVPENAFAFAAGCREVHAVSYLDGGSLGDSGSVADAVEGRIVREGLHDPRQIDPFLEVEATLGDGEFLVTTRLYRLMRHAPTVGVVPYSGWGMTWVESAGGVGGMSDLLEAVEGHMDSFVSQYYEANSDCELLRAARDEALTPPYSPTPGGRGDVRR